jgi:PTS system cellobiose-specific IIC component
MITSSGGTVSETADSITVGAWGNLPVGYLNATGLFTALIVGLIFTIIFCKLMKTKMTIRLPESVPPAVSQAFVAIVPGTIVLFLAGTITWVLGLLHEAYPSIPGALGDIIQYFIQQPFMGASQGLGWVLLITFVAQFLWFFGMHGLNLLAPIINGVYLTALTENIAAWGANPVVADLPYKWTSASWDDFVWFGGSGATLGLIIAIFIFSKRKEYRVISTLALPMGVFNINEPIIFGLPIVLNPIFIIPWILTPLVMVTVAFLATQLGLVPPVIILLPWITPPIIGAFIGTGFSWAAAVLAVINIGISFVIWSIFVIMANRIGLKSDEDETPTAEPEAVTAS